MALQNVDHPTVHRPMSLLLQALKQIELKTQVPVAAEQTADAVPRVSSPRNAEPRVAETKVDLPPKFDAIDLIRQYEASETASEIALAGPVQIAAVPLVATPGAREPRSTSHDLRRRGRFAGDILKLLPHDNRPVIALAPVEGIDLWPVIRELCRSLAAQADGDVLAIGQMPSQVAPESLSVARLSDVLSGRATWQSAVRQDAEEGFFTLERGDDETIAASNGRSLLKLWQELNEQFAYVVIDVGPTEKGAVASLLGSCDGTFAVVRLDRTNRREAERLITRIRSVGGRACGCLVVE
ncbi:MAG TPA: hypothetical protein VG125_21580 [Pirellulales bacterium]|jgi:hypothetical protein|nr:hypothetical protein [Pirellulales bacterium]